MEYPSNGSPRRCLANARPVGSVTPSKTNRPVSPIRADPANRPPPADSAQPGRQSLALWMSAVVLILVGCRDDDPAPTTPAASVPAFLIDEDSRTHHFGAVVSRPGKTLLHRFRLANATGHPVRLAQVINRKSCCGEIKVGATTLPPGDRPRSSSS